MAYDYLFELYTILERTRTEAGQRLRAAEAENNQEAMAYQRGVHDLARDMEAFLAANYNRMLPRKMRERLEMDGVSAVT